MVIKRLVVLLPVLLVLVGCTASTLSVGNANEDGAAAATAAISRETDSDEASGLDVDVIQTAAPPVMGSESSVDVQYTFEVKNRGTEPVAVKRISIWSAGGAYEVESRSRTFKKTVAPGATEKFPFWARAIGVSSLTGTSGPITLRTELQVEDSQGLRKAAFVRQVGGRVSVGVTGQQ